MSGESLELALVKVLQILKLKQAITFIFKCGISIKDRWRNNLLLSLIHSICLFTKLELHLLARIIISPLNNCIIFILFFVYVHLI